MNRRLDANKVRPVGRVAPLLGTAPAAVAAHVLVGELFEWSVRRADDEDLVSGIDPIDMRIVVAVAVVLATALEEFFFSNTAGHPSKMPEGAIEVKVLGRGMAGMACRSAREGSAEESRQRSFARGQSGQCAPTRDSATPSDDQRSGKAAEVVAG